MKKLFANLLASFTFAALALSAQQYTVTPQIIEVHNQAYLGQFDAYHVQTAAMFANQFRGYKIKPLLDEWISIVSLQYNLFDVMDLNESNYQTAFSQQTVQTFKASTVEKRAAAFEALKALFIDTYGKVSLESQRTNLSELFGSVSWLITAPNIEANEGTSVVGYIVVVRVYSLDDLSKPSQILTNLRDMKI